jgi:hypothetical protein
VILTREIEDGLAAAYYAGGFVPLTEEQIEAVTGPSPPYPQSLPRTIDSNPEPREG